MPNVFDLPALPTVAIDGDDGRFPVGRIFCVGRNYADHAREMGSNPDREPPFFFSKFAQALVPGGGTIPYPPVTGDLHYEAELVVAIGHEGAAVAAERALDLVYGYAAGLDMTRRDLQAQAKDKGRPWDIAKNFAFSAPIGSLRRVADAGHLASGEITLALNGVIRQRGDIGDMIWNVAEVIAHLSRLERLLPGDLIYTGTPSGVGAVAPGDRLTVSIAGLGPLAVTIGEREADFA
ncbi:fumarylacetoacetate hydrolase family protein [uncultured Sphingomonas sp.]|uniref:fumarylacetoacetate hydrolase family protein n=1 Tax=uncultured Sphingomonas sp. TaxID=158754 RepID=UPI0026076EF1|nr:fumarylacetoacetate hydrolase family protein [uncultured Sphingomonas sp.]